VTKVFNEGLGEYYQAKYGMDFRSIRYPGVISSAKYAFNGTTDYSTGKSKQKPFPNIFLIFLENRNFFPRPEEPSLQMLVR